MSPIVKAPQSGSDVPSVKRTHVTPPQTPHKTRRYGPSTPNKLNTQVQILPGIVDLKPKVRNKSPQKEQCDPSAEEINEAIRLFSTRHPRNQQIPYYREIAFAAFEDANKR